MNDRSPLSPAEKWRLLQAQKLIDLYEKAKAEESSGQSPDAEADHG